MTCQASLSEEADRSLQVGVYIYFLYYMTVCPFSPESCTLSCAAVTHDNKGMLPRLTQLWTEKADSGMQLSALCMHHALGHLNF